MPDRSSGLRSDNFSRRKYLFAEERGCSPASGVNCLITGYEENGGCECKRRLVDNESLPTSIDLDHAKNIDLEVAAETLKQDEGVSKGSIDGPCDQSFGWDFGAGLDDFYQNTPVVDNDEIFTFCPSNSPEHVAFRSSVFDRLLRASSNGVRTRIQQQKLAEKCKHLAGLLLDAMVGRIGLEDDKWLWEHFQSSKFDGTWPAMICGLYQGMYLYNSEVVRKHFSAAFNNIHPLLASGKLTVLLFRLQHFQHFQFLVAHSNIKDFWPYNVDDAKDMLDGIWRGTSRVLLSCLLTSLQSTINEIQKWASHHIADITKSWPSSWVLLENKRETYEKPEKIFSGDCSATCKSQLVEETMPALSCIGCGQPKMPHIFLGANMLPTEWVGTLIDLEYVNDLGGLICILQGDPYFSEDDECTSWCIVRHDLTGLLLCKDLMDDAYHNKANLSNEGSHLEYVGALQVATRDRVTTVTSLQDDGTYFHGNLKEFTSGITECGVKSCAARALNTLPDGDFLDKSLLKCSALHLMALAFSVGKNQNLKFHWIGNSGHIEFDYEEENFCRLKECCVLYTKEARLIGQDVIWRGDGGLSGWWTVDFPGDKKPPRPQGLQDPPSPQSTHKDAGGSTSYRNEGRNKMNHQENEIADTKSFHDENHQIARTLQRDLADCQDFAKEKGDKIEKVQVVSTSSKLEVEDQEADLKGKGIMPTISNVRIDLNSTFKRKEFASSSSSQGAEVFDPLRGAPVLEEGTLHHGGVFHPLPDEQEDEIEGPVIALQDLQHLMRTNPLKALHVMEMPSNEPPGCHDGRLDNMTNILLQHVLDFNRQMRKSNDSLDNLERERRKMMEATTHLKPEEIQKVDLGALAANKRAFSFGLGILGLINVNGSFERRSKATEFLIEYLESRLRLSVAMTGTVVLPPEIREDRFQFVEAKLRNGTLKDCPEEFLIVRNDNNSTCMQVFICIPATKKFVFLTDVIEANPDVVTEIFKKSLHGSWLRVSRSGSKIKVCPKGQTINSRFRPFDMLRRNANIVCSKNMVLHSKLQGFPSSEDRWNYIIGDQKELNGKGLFWRATEMQAIMCSATRFTTGAALIRTLQPCGDEIHGYCTSLASPDHYIPAQKVEAYGKLSSYKGIGFPFAHWG